jgi:hypothetical protein
MLDSVESMHRNLAALIVAVLVGSGAAAVADDVVWQLRLQNGRPADCWLGSTQAGQGAGNQPFLAADTRSRLDIVQDQVLRIQKRKQNAA